MKLLHGTKVKEALHELRANCIAVAYIGADWRSFIDPAALKEVIVSPTAGSSAEAIQELVGHLRWENVYFLDELHAKIYLGDEAAAVGSFNLTANGLSGHALSEAGVLIDDAAALTELHTLFEWYRAAAIKRYPNQVSKEKRLDVLRELNGKLGDAEVTSRRSTRSKSLANFVPATGTDFYIGYYQDGETEINRQALRAAAPDVYTSESQDPDDFLANYLPFLKNDTVRPGHWLLMWHAGDEGEQRMDLVPNKLEVSWMYVNSVIPTGANDDPRGYTKLAVQWKGARGIGSPPFKIGKSEKAALRALLASGDFPEFLPRVDHRRWSLDKTFVRFREFVEAWKRLTAAS
jgi:hypothetical protein